MAFLQSHFFVLFDLYEWSGEDTHDQLLYRFVVATLEEPPSESEGEYGKDLSSNEEQDLWDQFDDPVDDDEEPEILVWILNMGWQIPVTAQSSIIVARGFRTFAVLSLNCQVNQLDLKNRRLMFPSQHSAPQVNLKSL